MLDSPPRESEWRSWAYVLTGTVVIFLTIPVARALRGWIELYVGLNFFLYAAAAVTLLVGVWALRNLRTRNLPLSAYLCLFGFIALFLAYIYRLRDIPEEAIHVAEYGVIGILLFRALSHRIRDYSIYLVATVLVGMIGVLDEYIQWVTPTRYFDYRDIQTNLISGALGQLTLALGLRPRIVSAWPPRVSWQRLSRVLAAGLCLLLVGLLNTPSRIGWYANSIPTLSFLLDSHNMMAEYGYRYQDPDIGIFRSRFTADELQALDQQRGMAVAEILDTHIDDNGYDLFFDRITVPRDAYAHEAGIHLFRRDRYFDRAREEPEEKTAHYHVAYHENLILQKYFPTALNASRHPWNRARTELVRSGFSATGSYESPVSAGVITRFTEFQLAGLMLLAITALLILGYVPPGWQGGKPTTNRR